MISKDEAIRIAEDRENNGRYGPHVGAEKRVVDDEMTIERDYGWLFVLHKADYVRTRERRYRIVGLGPVLVLREDGSVIEFSSAYHGEKALAEFEADPEKHRRGV